MGERVSTNRKIVKQKSVLMDLPNTTVGYIGPPMVLKQLLPKGESVKDTGLVQIFIIRLNDSLRHTT